MKHRLAILLATASAPFLPADELTLSNGDILSGSTREITAEGRIVFESPNASEPFIVRSEALDTLRFAFEQPEDIPQTERVQLHNGDVLPGEILGLNEESIELRTWACGDLHIPRSAVASVNFGVAPHDLVFKGPGKEGGWRNNENWNFRDDHLSSSSRGTIGRPDVLPSQFILRFRLDWESNPNFRFYFCDDLMERSGEADRYYFEVNTAGLQLKRQSANSKRRWHPLYSNDRRPASFPDQSMEIELRVDRDRRLIYVYIDGESDGRHHDPIGEIPAGTGIMLESLAGGDMKNIISSIEIYKWDAISQIHRTEGHKNEKADAVVTGESERYAGAVKALQGSGADRVLLVESPHTDEALRIPFEALSMLYFRKPAEEVAHSGDFRITLAALGQLSFSKPKLGADALAFEHPLLGELSVRRDAIESLQSISDSPVETNP